MPPLLRVALLGAESTGKTTLARALALHYGTTWVPEAARLYVDEHGPDLTAADVEPIARLHLEQADQAAAAAHRVLVLDTDLFATWVYSAHYYGATPAWVQAAALREAADLYLLTAADIPWQPDPGQRDGARTRAILQPRFAAVLAAHLLPTVAVAGTPDARLATAVRAIDAVLRTSSLPRPGSPPG